MAAISALTLREPIIPVQRTFNYEDVTTVKLENRWLTTANGTDYTYAKAYLPSISDVENKELLLYVIDQFYHHCSDNRLRLNTGDLCYSKFSEVLGSDLKIIWQELADNRDPKSNDTFIIDTANFILTYLSETSFADQREYLRGVTKPYNMSCEVLTSRLRVINNLSVFLPGCVNRVTLYPDEFSLKRAYFQMMPMPWHIKFVENRQPMDSAAFTLVHLTRFMSVQEALSKRSDGPLASKKRKYSDTRRQERQGNSYRHRGRGFGGRGSGGR